MKPGRLIGPVLFLTFLILLWSGTLFADLCCKREYLYLKNARISTSADIHEYGFLEERNKTTNRVLSGHYISPGNNLVVLFRESDCGDPSVDDDQTFTKITIEIENYKSYTPISLSSPEVKFRYSHGNSRYMYRGAGINSSTGSGEITIMERNNKYLFIKMDIKLQAEPAEGFFHKDKSLEKRLYKTRALKEISMDEITPWLGAPNPSIDREVYPDE